MFYTGHFRLYHYKITFQNYDKKKINSKQKLTRKTKIAWEIKHMLMVILQHSDWYYKHSFQLNSITCLRSTFFTSSVSHCLNLYLLFSFEWKEIRMNRMSTASAKILNLVIIAYEKKKVNFLLISSASCDNLLIASKCHIFFSFFCFFLLSILHLFFVRVFCHSLISFVHFYLCRNDDDSCFWPLLYYRLPWFACVWMSARILSIVTHAPC